MKRCTVRRPRLACGVISCAWNTRLCMLAPRLRLPDDTGAFAFAVGVELAAAAAAKAEDEEEDEEEAEGEEEGKKAGQPQLNTRTFHLMGCGARIHT